MNSNIVLEIEIPCNVGQITKKKIDVLQEKFSSEFQNAFWGNDREMLVMEAEDRSVAIILSSNALRININKYKENDIDEIVKYLKRLLEIFMLDDIFEKLIFRTVSQVMTDFNSMDKTKEIGEDITNSIGISNVSGVGFRYLFKKEDNVFDEFRMEPLLLDDNKLYFEGIYNEFDIHIDKLDESIKEKVNAFINLKDKAYSNIKQGNYRQ